MFTNSLQNKQHAGGHLKNRIDFNCKTKNTPKLDFELFNFSRIEAEWFDEESFCVGERTGVHLRTDGALQLELKSFEVGPRHVGDFVEFADLLADLVDRKLNRAHLKQATTNYSSAHTDGTFQIYCTLTSTDVESTTRIRLVTYGKL